MTDIPRARAILRGVIDELNSSGDVDVADIEEALSLMTRVITRDVAKRERFNPTPAQKKRIRELIDCSELSYAEICIAVGINPKMSGRISDMHTGKRP